MNLDGILAEINDKDISGNLDNYYRMIRCLVLEIRDLKEEIEHLKYSKADDANYNPMEE